MSEVAESKGLPLAVVFKAENCETVDDLLAWAELNYPDTFISREEARRLMGHRVKETELDEQALNPTSIDVLLGRIDRSLHKEIRRIADRIDLLSDIAAETPGKAFELDNGDVLTPEDARAELVCLRETMLDMKKELVNQKKVETAATVAGNGVNVNVDLGSILTQGIENIKRMELPEEARVIDMK